MASHSFYRKWRSRTFADVVGQGHVTRTLRNAVQTGHVAHAYLFTGPRGVGKTSVARILAKALNCAEPQQGEPCDRCDMCAAIAGGRALDVIEIDAASNRRIEEMRDLRDKVNFAPSEGRYKVYILDEAHMLTPEASNALLKTLEEPPPHTVFVLVTTEAHRIAETIASRCQRFNFRRIASRETIDRLGLICEAEHLAVPPDALALVARAATGSLRDAEGLLDQIVAYCGEEISAEQVRHVLGLSSEEAIRRLGEYVVAGDLAGGLNLINELAEGEGDLRRFGEDFLAFLRGVLLWKSGAGTDAIGDLSAETVEAMRGCAERTNLDYIVRLVRIFAAAEPGGRSGAPTQLALELAVAEAALAREGEQKGTAAAPDGEQTVSARTALGQGARPTAGRTLAMTRPSAGAKSGVDAGRTDTAGIRPAKGSGADGGDGETPHEALKRLVGQGAPAVGAEPPKTSNEQAAADDSQGTLFETLQRRWGDVVEALGLVNKLLQAVLRSCGPYQERGGAVVIGCDSTFHRDRLSERSNRQLLEKTVGEILGRAVALEFDVVARQARGQQPPVTSDPLVKEVLSWGGRIRAVVPVAEPAAEGQPGQKSARSDSEVNDEP